MIYFYNTMTRKKEKFVPISEKEVYKPVNIKVHLKRIKE